ncbi:hypothetical protein, partial [Bradyrhizobium sp. CCBAU 45394]
KTLAGADRRHPPNLLRLWQRKNQLDDSQMCLRESLGSGKIGNPGLARPFDLGIIETRTGPLMASRRPLSMWQGGCQVFLVPRDPVGDVLYGTELLDLCYWRSTAKIDT